MRRIAVVTAIALTLVTGPTLAGASNSPGEAEEALARPVAYFQIQGGVAWYPRWYPMGGGAVGVWVMTPVRSPSNTPVSPVLQARFCGYMGPISALWKGEAGGGVRFGASHGGVILHGGAIAGYSQFQYAGGGLLGGYVAVAGVGPAAGRTGLGGEFKVSITPVANPNQPYYEVHVVSALHVAGLFR